ncbi:hypothetical protein MHH52_04500 [Paenibacillus sp. FSL K6-0276]|uniref:hypothetical protein n=1 Tax=Paenibacillus sp. FSL K6-0276 TaxID=2921450 RepID=UPI0030EE49C2
MLFRPNAANVRDFYRSFTLLQPNAANVRDFHRSFALFQPNAANVRDFYRSFMLLQPNAANVRDFYRSFTLLRSNAATLRDLNLPSFFRELICQLSIYSLELPICLPFVSLEYTEKIKVNASAATVSDTSAI